MVKHAGVHFFQLPQRKYLLRLTALSGEKWSKSWVGLKLELIMVEFRAWLPLWLCFMDVSGGRLLDRMIPDKWGSKCWPFNELRASEHLLRGLVLSHRALYMAGTRPQWVTDPWPITTFTWLIHTRPHHDFSLCRWTLGTISHGKGLGKGQLPFCMAIKQGSVCQSFLLSHSPSEFLDTI